MEPDGTGAGRIMKQAVERAGRVLRSRRCADQSCWHRNLR